jgi:hypothetical protein
MSATGGSVRRAGFAASAACGLALMALSVGGMATLDDQLQAAAPPPAKEERVILETRDAGVRIGEDRECDRPSGERPARSGEAA